MNKYYKPFSQQGRECRDSGDLYLEDCIQCGKKIIACKKYGGQCRSNKCKEERTTKPTMELTTANLDFRDHNGLSKSIMRRLKVQKNG